MINIHTKGGSMQLSILNISELPLVTVTKFPENMVEVKMWIDEVEHVMSLGKGFCLYYPSSKMTEEQKKAIALGKKLLSLWLKKGRQSFKDTFKVMIIMAENAEHYEYLKEVSLHLSDTYGVPVYVAKSDDEVHQVVPFFQNLYFK